MERLNCSNVTWSFDRLADGSIHAFAWSTDSGDSIAAATAASKIEAGKALYRQLAAKLSALGRALVSKNGDVLTAEGPLNLAGQLSNAL